MLILLKHLFFSHEQGQSTNMMLFNYVAPRVPQLLFARLTAILVLIHCCKGKVWTRRASKSNQMIFENVRKIDSNDINIVDIYRFKNYASKCCENFKFFKLNFLIVKFSQHYIDIRNQRTKKHDIWCRYCRNL